MRSGLHESFNLAGVIVSVCPDELNDSHNVWIGKQSAWVVSIAIKVLTEKCVNLIYKKNATYFTLGFLRKLIIFFVC